MAASDDKFKDLNDFAGIALDWFWETDAEHRFSYFSSRMQEVTKLQPSDILGKRRDRIKAEGRSQEEWDAHLADLSAHRPFRNFEYVLTRPTDGSKLWVRVSGQPVFDKDGVFQGYRGAAHDVTTEIEQMERLAASNKELAKRNRELVRMRRELERSALEDALTQVPNRRAFERDLPAALASAKHNIGLLHIDLDRFKWINDTLGHPAGDAVLVVAARRISTVIGEHGVLYRMGGDEFMVILAEPRAEQQADWIGDSIVEAINAPIRHDQHRINIGASVGIAFGSGEDSTMASLVADADVALYEAKRGGRNSACRITPHMQQQMMAQRSLAAELPRALAEGELVPYFQPQVHMGTKAVVGAETLVRWRHPERGLLLPGEFLTMASELGLLADIDALMLNNALAVAARLRSQGIVLPSVSVNISAARLLDPRLPEDIERLWRYRDCRLCIELLETIYFDETQDSPVLTENLRRLRDLGVRIEIDDFGSGRASITGLLKIRPDRLKIDRSLIKAAVTDPVKRSVAAAILDMARALGIEGMAEGVEKPEDIEAIRSMGCNIFQGHAIAKPMDEAALGTFLKSRSGTTHLKTQTAGHIGLPKLA